MGLGFLQAYATSMNYPARLYPQSEQNHSADKGLVHTLAFKSCHSLCCQELSRSCVVMVSSGWPVNSCSGKLEL